MQYCPNFTRALSGVLASVAALTAIVLTPLGALSQQAWGQSAAAQSPAAIHNALPTGGHVALIKIEGLIYDYHLRSLEERVNQAVAHGASLVVIELDTPGGVLASALKISKHLKTISIPTVAWVNPEAYSAGILIAASCQRIVMAPSSATGDCAPIVPGMSLAPTERAKALSPLLEEFRDSASQNGHEYVLFHAMCVLGVEIYQVKHKQTGQVKLVNQADYAVMVKGASPDGGLLGKVLPSFRPDDVAAVTVSEATEADQEQWELVKKIHDGNTLLTLSQTRAIETGLAQATVKDAADLQRFLGATQLTVFPPNQVALVAYWLNQMWVRMLLIFLLMIGAFIEMQSPGLGVGGLIALISLAVLIAAPYLVGLAQMWHVVLFVVGVLLLMAELFVVPGFGVTGAAGIICVFTGLVLMVVPSSGSGWLPMPAPGMSSVLREAVVYTIAGVLMSFVGFFFLARHFGSIPIFNRLILQDLVPAGGPSSSRVGATVMPAQGGGSGVGVCEGAQGVAITALRPSGSIQINDQIIDVVTLGEWIETGSRVKVVEVRGNRVVVDIVQSPA